MSEFIQIQKWYRDYLNKNKNDHDEIYFHRVFIRKMYRKRCSICSYDIYMFDNTKEFKQHQIECFKFNFINKKQIKFNS